MRNVLDKNCRENQNAHFIFSNFFPENRAVYEVISRNVVEPERPQTIWRRVVCCVSKATRATTHASARSRTPPTTQMCNTAFATAAVVFVKAPQMLRYTYIACVAVFRFRVSGSSLQCHVVRSFMATYSMVWTLLHASLNLQSGYSEPDCVNNFEPNLVLLRDKTA